MATQAKSRNTSLASRLIDLAASNAIFLLILHYALRESWLKAAIVVVAMLPITYVRHRIRDSLGEARREFERTIFIEGSAIAFLLSSTGLVIFQGLQDTYHWHVSLSDLLIPVMTGSFVLGILIAWRRHS